MKAKRQRVLSDTSNPGKSDFSHTQELKIFLLVGDKKFVLKVMSIFLLI